MGYSVAGRADLDVKNALGCLCHISALLVQTCLHSIYLAIRRCKECRAAVQVLPTVVGASGAVFLGGVGVGGFPFPFLQFFGQVARPSV